MLGVSDKVASVADVDMSAPTGRTRSVVVPVRCPAVSGKTLPAANETKAVACLVVDETTALVVVAVADGRLVSVANEKVSEAAAWKIASALNTSVCGSA